MLLQKNEIFLSSVIFLLGLGFSFSVGATDSVTTQEFEKLRRERENRLQDFYVRLNQIEWQNTERQRGENEKRKERKTIKKEYEQSRQEYVLQRKQRPVQDPAAFEQELKQRLAEHEAARRQFVVNRDKMLDAVKKIGVIPPEDELDLSLTPEDED